ncbi:MAG: sugar phosphate isomerase/epimerase [Planctomycetaceae bacterium]|nr:MAG: sugar phosphate isomerase/epimerase [Planctomycetaceae bacterium]
MRLGIVTYLWGAEWDLATLIKNCADAGFEGAELRTTHKHGVEISLTAEQRREARKQFEDSPVTFVGPGTACEFHAADPAVVKKNIEETRQFVELSHDIGGTGVKVRPNGFVAGEERQTTINRIGSALRECGEFADGYGQEIRVEVHGPGTQDLAVMRQIIEAADHPQVVVCWNSNPGEVVDGSIAGAFQQVQNKLGQTVHIHDLYDRSYPYRELFTLLKRQDYDGFLLSESPATTDPLRVMRYYRALFDELTR